MLHSDMSAMSTRVMPPMTARVLQLRSRMSPTPVYCRVDSETTMSAKGLPPAQVKKKGGEWLPAPSAQIPFR